MIVVDKQTKKAESIVYFNNNSQPITKVDSFFTTFYKYDALNRLTSKTKVDSIIAFNRETLSFTKPSDISKSATITNIKEIQKAILNKDLRGVRINGKILIPKGWNRKQTPTKPHSSENTAKIKSVWCAGKKLSWPWVPSPKPLPKTPPLPIAILD